MLTNECKICHTMCDKHLGIINTISKSLTLFASTPRKLEKDNMIVNTTPNSIMSDDTVKHIELIESEFVEEVDATVTTRVCSPVRETTTSSSDNRNIPPKPLVRVADIDGDNIIKGQSKLVEVKSEFKPCKPSKAHKTHKFEKIRGTSIISSSTPLGVYSEISFIIWLRAESQYQYSQPDNKRIVISLILDSKDDIWSVSAKLIKRTSYSSRDEEDGQIANRLCLSDKLLLEIKNMLLNMNISPREAYKSFRRNLQEDVVITRQILDFLTVETTSNVFFTNDLENRKNTLSSTTSTASKYDEEERKWLSPDSSANLRKAHRHKYSSF